MFKIKMFGIIGLDVTEVDIQDKLNEAAGQDLEIDLSSVGGQVSKGLLISDSFKNYKKDYPNSQMILNIKAEAASMASHIASLPIWDLITVEETSLYMIHNPQGAAFGDYREMQSANDFLSRYASVMAIEYQRKSKKPMQEIRQIMDDETYFFGQEIIDAGFADELIKSDDQNKMIKDEAVIMYKEKFETAMEKVNKEKPKKEDYEKAIALMDKTQPQQKANNPASGGENNNQEDIVKDINELKAKHPEVYAEAEKEFSMAGKQQGIDEIKANTKALMEFKKQPEFEGIQAIHERIDEAIEKCEDISDTKIAVMAILSKNSTQAHMDSPEDIQTGEDVSISGEQDNKTEMKARW